MVSLGGSMTKRLPTKRITTERITTKLIMTERIVTKDTRIMRKCLKRQNVHGQNTKKDRRYNVTKRLM
jgi:hypothetical protein